MGYVWVSKSQFLLFRFPEKRKYGCTPRKNRGNKINKLENEIDNKRRNANQAIGCGVVLGGHTAINCLMDL